jgi:Zn-dependent peptidase ImmA (M78 family)
MQAYINPELLKWARTKAGFSIEEAAKSYLNPEKLRKAEEGEEKLTFKQFLTIANKYKRPPAFFYLENPPREEVIKKNNDFRTIESRDVRFSPQLRDEIENVKEKRDLAVKYKSYDRVYDYSFISSISLNDKPEIISQKILKILNLHFKDRKEWSSKYDAFNSWKERIENVGVLIFQISGIKVEEMRGYSIPRTPYPTIVVNRSDSVLGRIFTLAHEFCHLMLKKGGICTISRGEEEKHFKIEKFCNAVAGEALVPKDILLKNKIIIKSKPLKKWNEDELRQLSKEFWASKEVILRRLSDLNKASKKYYQQKREQWSKRTTPRTSEGGPPPYRKVISGHSKNYLNIVLNAMDNREITMHDASYYLGISLKHLPKLREHL